jgi:predicted Zn-dependent protease
VGVDSSRAGQACDDKAGRRHQGRLGEARQAHGEPVVRPNEATGRKLLTWLTGLLMLLIPPALQAQAGPVSAPAVAAADTAAVNHSVPLPQAPSPMAPNFSPHNLPQVPEEMVTLAVVPPPPEPVIDTAVPNVGSNLGKVAAKYDVSHIGDRGIGKGVNFYSLEKEIALGRDLSREVESSAVLITDPVVTEYVNRIGQNLVRNSDAKVPFTIKVIDNDEINAYALPGGFFYVNSGLILAADNEAELAGVMAHEIAHVAARHATKTATKVEIWNIASIPLIFLGGPAGFAVRQAAALLVPMGFLKFSRDMEREADLLGIEYDYAAGYDPSALVDFFERLQAKKNQKHSALAKAFSTHPMTEDRIQRAEKEILTMLPARDQYLVDTSEFEDMKARLFSLTSKRHLQVGKPQPTLMRRNERGASSGSGQAPADDPNRPTLEKRPPKDSPPSNPPSDSKPN